MSTQQPLFILCPGRSFSSVVAAIIGQHPDCYGLPELDLFLGDTLGESADNYARKGRRALTGLKRTIAQLHHGQQTVETVQEATKWIEANFHLTGKEILDHIQDLVGPKILVDKSPSSVTRAAGLNRIALNYPKANFLQLLRHPRSRGVSQMKALRGQKVLQIMSRAFGEVDYELKWSVTHQMISDFGASLPLGQLMRVRGEDLLRDLRLYLPQICEWLDISSDATAIDRMLHPEASPYSCIGPENARFGANPGFLENPALDFEKLAEMTEPTLEAPMDWSPDKHFSPQTRYLASCFGYR